MIKKAIIYNNPFLAFKYHADINFTSGAVIYKTNTELPFECYGRLRYSECFFFIEKEKAQRFASLLSMTGDWNSSYDKGIIIDGYQWAITTVNGGKKEIYGINDKPDKLDYIMSEVENLLGKDFTSRCFQLSIDNPL